MELIEKLVEGCIQNDRSNQRLLYQKYAPTMLGVCLRFARTKEEAEDVLQEGFLKVFNKIHQYNFEGSFEGWIRKIMVNTALEKLRSGRKLYPIVNIEAIHAEGIIVEDFTLTHLAAKDLLRMVQQLPPMYRMVFNLYVFEGYKHREIADLLGISEGTSKSNLSDARTILRKAVLGNQLISKQNSF